MEKEPNIRDISRLILKMIRKNITEEEKALLDCWLNESKEHQNMYERLRDEQYLFEQYRLKQRVNTDKAWNRIIAPRKRSFVRYIGYAAAVILLIGSSLTYFLLSGSKEHLQSSSMIAHQVKPGSGKATLIISGKQEILLGKDRQIDIIDSTGTTYQNDSSTLYYQAQKTTTLTTIADNIHTLVVGRGSEYSVILADGTKVYLNSDSKLKYPTTFTQAERKVYLEGEAYFEVSPDKKHPFIVEGKNFAVKVLGTSFNVSNYKDDDASRIVLLEGSVQVNKSDKEYKLKPNQAIEIKGDQVNVRNVNAANAISWKNDKFYFSNERLEIVMMKLARWYDVNLFYMNQSIKDYHFTGFIPKYADISKTFSLLELTTDVKFELKNREVVIMKKE